MKLANTPYKLVPVQIKPSNANSKPKKEVTVKLTKILGNLQPVNIVKLSYAKPQEIESINLNPKSLLDQTITDRPYPTKRKEINMAVPYNINIASTKRTGVPTYKTRISSSHIRSLSHGRIRQNLVKDNNNTMINKEASFEGNVSALPLLRNEKAPMKTRAKLIRVNSTAHGISIEQKADQSQVSQAAPVEISLKDISLKKHARQKSMLAPHKIAVGTSFEIQCGLNKSEKSVIARSESTAQIENGAQKIIIKKDHCIKWKHLLFNPDAGREILEGHYKMTVDGLTYAVKHLKPPSLAYVEARGVTLGERPNQFKKTLVLDLDETLITSCTLEDKPDMILTPKEGSDVRIYIKIRPYAFDFLNVMKNHFEILVFTASSELYAKSVVKALDPNGDCISHVFHREFCFETNRGIRIKDLRIFRNRHLKDLIIIDNFIPAFSFQLENGVPILEWRGDKKDKELMYLMNYLLNAKDQEDLREYNREKMSLLHLAKTTIDMEAP